jgi:hypothetical protein
MPGSHDHPAWWAEAGRKDPDRIDAWVRAQLEGRTRVEPVRRMKSEGARRVFSQRAPSCISMRCGGRTQPFLARPSPFRTSK